MIVWSFLFLLLLLAHSSSAGTRSTTSSTATRLRGANSSRNNNNNKKNTPTRTTFLLSRSTTKTTNTHDIKRKLLEDIDHILYADDNNAKVGYDHQSNGILNLVDKTQENGSPMNKVEIDVYTLLPERYTSNDYLGQLEGLLPTETVYHNKNFFLSMDVREHRYEEVNLDAFGFIRNTATSGSTESYSTFSQPSALIYNDDLNHKFDTRAVIGLMGLLPGTNPLDSLDDELIEPRIHYDKTSVLGYLDKGTSVMDSFDSDAFHGQPTTMDNWVGQLHGLLPQGTYYHNKDFHLSFDPVEHQYESLGHTMIDVNGKITTGDKFNPEVYQSAIIPGSDERKVVGLLGLLPGTTQRTLFAIDTIQAQPYEVQPYATSMVNLLDMVIPENRVEPEAYQDPQLFGEGFVGQLHGLLPDFDNKMQYLKFEYDGLISDRGEGGDVKAVFVDLFGKVTESQTVGVHADAPESGHDVTAALETPNPTPSPTASPSVVPSVSLTPSLPHAPLSCGATYGSCQSNPLESAKYHELHAVRCCSENPMTGWEKNSNCDVWAESDIGGKCYERETLASAEDICASQGVGVRLCTREEIEGDCAAGSGCGFDHQMVWLSNKASTVEAES